jgi:MinD-like ATPase involved in chromosome partitioning or flagellar assembly
LSDTAAAVAVPVDVGGDDDLGAAFDHLSRTYPDLADTLRASDRLADALREARSQTGATAESVARTIGERELASAKKPIEVLVSRCRSAIKTAAETAAESGAASAPGVDANDISPEAATVDETAPLALAEPTPSPAPMPTVRPDVPGGVRLWRRARVDETAPLDLPADVARRLGAAIEGSRSLVVMGVTGGAGSSTVAVLLAQVLAAVRTDRVVVADAAGLPGGAAAIAAPGHAVGLREIITREAGDEHAATSVGHLTVAGLSIGDDPLTVDEYSRAIRSLLDSHGLVVTDAGTAASGDVARTAVAAADLLVVVAPPTVHGMRCLDHRLDRLAGDGGIERSRVLVVVNAQHRRTPVQPQRVATLVAGRCASFASIPWDRNLAPGDAIDLRRLQNVTLYAVAAAGAALIEALGEQPV